MYIRWKSLPRISQNDQWMQRSPYMCTVHILNSMARCLYIGTDFPFRIHVNLLARQQLPTVISWDLFQTTCCSAVCDWNGTASSQTTDIKNAYYILFLIFLWLYPVLPSVAQFVCIYRHSRFCIYRKADETNWIHSVIWPNWHNTVQLRILCVLVSFMNT
jgi:hypothetical protein